jgi:predicted dehydrogenase
MMEVMGSRGRIRATDPGMAPFTVADVNGLRQPVNFPTLLHVDQAYVEELAAFARHIRHGDPLLVTPREARGAVELSVAAVLSSRRAEPVALPLTGKERSGDPSA